MAVKILLIFLSKLVFFVYYVTIICINTFLKILEILEKRRKTNSNSNSFINKTIAALRLNYGLFTYNNNHKNK